MAAGAVGTGMDAGRSLQTDPGQKGKFSQWVPLSKVGQSFGRATHRKGFNPISSSSV